RCLVQHSTSLRRTSQITMSRGYPPTAIRRPSGLKSAVTRYPHSSAPPELLPVPTFTRRNQPPPLTVARRLSSGEKPTHVLSRRSAWSVLTISRLPTSQTTVDRVP